VTDPLTVAILAIAGMFVLIGLHVPIGAAMGISGFLAFGVSSGFAPAVSLFGTEASSAIANLDLAVIPLPGCRPTSTGSPTRFSATAGAGSRSRPSSAAPGSARCADPRSRPRRP
jgi:hypothetical protein